MFGNKLDKIGASFATFLFGLSTAAEVRLITSETAPDFLEANEYNVLSFFDPSNAASVETDQIMQGAMAYFENKVRIGDWHGRSVGWLRIDLSTAPELALNEEAQPE